MKPIPEFTLSSAISSRIKNKKKIKKEHLPSKSAGNPEQGDLAGDTATGQALFFLFSFYYF